MHREAEDETHPFSDLWHGQPGLLAWYLDITYGVEIAEGQEEALLLAVTVCIDQMARG